MSEFTDLLIQALTAKAIDEVARADQLDRIEAQQAEIVTLLKKGQNDAPAIPVPSLYPRTAQTIALWDWETAQIANVPPGGVIPADTPAIGPVSSNDTNAAGEGAYTRIVPTTGRKVVEFAANHDMVQRAEGTAARLLMRDWGFWLPYVGKVLKTDYALYLPDAITLKAGGSLGLGLQTKHDKGVIWALDAENSRDGGLSPWIWNPVGKGVVKPITPFIYPLKTWVPIHVESLLHLTNGWADIFAGDTHLFHLTGRTLPGGIGLALYNVNAVAGWVRALFSDVRFDVA